MLEGFMVSSPRGLALACLDADLLGLRFGRFGQGHHEHAVLEASLDFRRVDLGGKLESTGETVRASLASMRRVTLGRLDLAFAFECQRRRRRRKLEVLVGKAW